MSTVTVSHDDLVESWGPACDTTRLAAFEFWTGVKAQVDARSIPAWQALDRILHAHNYQPRPGVTGGYSCRHVTGGHKPSLHAVGIAVDINWDRNPYGRRLVTDMPERMIRHVELITTTAGVPVFRWGGRYKRNKDAMHFEVVVTPDQLNDGVVAPPAAIPPPSTTIRVVVLTLGMKGQAVADLQQLLNNTGVLPVTLTVDGAFGPATKRAVETVQTGAHLPVDGKVGGDTWRWLADQAGFPVL